MGQVDGTQEPGDQADPFATDAAADPADEDTGDRPEHRLPEPGVSKLSPKVRNTAARYAGRDGSARKLSDT